ncbi:MAG: UDP-N-acetylmuramoyl-tripeptide--D-alanyl-D-alanine ligase [Clostridia bacterium]
MKLKVSDVYNALNEKMKCENDKLIAGVSIDSRTIKEGEIYFAIKGETHDGHEYVADVFKRGAYLAVCAKDKKTDMQDIPDSDDKIIFVESTTKALGDLASYYRDLFHIPFISVTGSTGKTTTKELINAALSVKYVTCATKGNHNNQTGVPNTLFTLTDECGASVIEMGMNHLHEISYLSRMVKPYIAVITNIGTSHIGKLGSRENIFKAKKEVLEYIQNGYAVVNGDDDLLSQLQDGENYKVIKVGIYAEDLDIRATNLVSSEINTYGFNALGTGFSLSIQGEHNVYNALSAIAVAKLLDLDMQKVSCALKDQKNQKMRMDISVVKSMTVINDAYNANYDSMKASFDVFRKYSQRKVAILGDMLELGSYEQEMHEKAGEYAASCKTDVLVLIGNNASYYRTGAIKGGMPGKYIFTFKDMEDAKKVILGIIKENDVILIKGSRGAQMENILKVIEGK